MTIPPQRLPIYLGPGVPRWLPATTDDVQALIDGGGMAEGHWVDGKRELKLGDSANKKLARDMSSFANDRGAVLIGVSEDKETRTFEVTPVERAGLSERVDRVARSRLDPPLFVICHPLSSPEDPNQGVLLIEIPASPQAPHQSIADAAYYGRADTTKTRLTDAEIARLHAVRTTRH